MSLAVAATLVTVWFTLLPSFGFILAGAPLVEASRGDLRFGAPLTAITAAVVGVIGSLAAFFSGPVLWPLGAFSPTAALVVALVLLACALGAVSSSNRLMAMATSSLSNFLSLLAGRQDSLWQLMGRSSSDVGLKRLASVCLSLRRTAGISANPL